MKYYEDFASSGLPFPDRVGEPDEFHAAMGHIALGFSYLEDTARNVIVLLCGADFKVTSVMVAEMSFRQKLNVLASMARHIASTLSCSSSALNHAELDLCIGELIKTCQRAEELRNTYLHSSYAGRERAKISAKADGLKIRREPVDASLLLDVADFIVYAGMELEGLPLLLEITDFTSCTERSISYSKNGSMVATFEFGKVCY